MYSPAEDSYLLSETLKTYLKKNKIRNKKIKILDMGSGSGIQAETCIALGFDNILCADIDKKSVFYLKRKKLKAVFSNLFSSQLLKNQKFDLIIFNPPYLPENEYDNQPDTTGGKKGYETILRFLNQAKSHLAENGEILILFSSLSNPEIIKEEAGRLNYNLVLLNKQKFSFETLYVFLIKQKRNY